MHHEHEQDVFILGTAYSGSTLIGNFLNAHPQVTYIGEINRLPKFGPPKIHDWEATQDCFYCKLKGQECPYWTPQTIEKFYANGESETFNTARTIFKTPIIVDGSKFLFWVRHMIEKGYDITRAKAIVSIKNPFATVYSIIKRGAFETFEAANTWRDTYFDIARSLNTWGISYVIVKYEDFYFNFEATARRIADFLHIEVTEEMQKFMELPVHSIGGNISPFAKSKDIAPKLAQTPNEKLTPITLGFNYTREYTTAEWGTFKDIRWIKHLEPWQISLIMSTPGLVDVASMYGYDIPEVLAEYTMIKNTQAT